MKNKFHYFFFSLTLSILLGCSLTGIKTTQEPTGSLPLTTLKPGTKATQEPTEILPPAIVKPDLNTEEATETQPENVDRWMLYEDALASRLLMIPNVRGTGLCEWEILGQDRREVYLWVMCQVADDPQGSATSAPVVVTLDDSGGIAQVDMPRDGSLYGEDILAMFPEDLWSVIFFETADIDGMWSHIQQRHNHPEPPLIVQQNIELP